MDHLKTDDTDVGGWTVERHVTALYQAHALSLARLALVMLGDRSTAEDVVQDAFLGLDPLVSADGKTVVCVCVTAAPGDRLPV